MINDEHLANEVEGAFTLDKASDLHVRILDGEEPSVVEGEYLFANAGPAEGVDAAEPGFVFEEAREAVKVVRSFEEEVCDGWMVRGLFSIELATVGKHPLHCLSQDRVQRGSALAV